MTMGEEEAGVTGGHGATIEKPCLVLLLRNPALMSDT